VTDFSLIDAWDDPVLFAEHFRGSTWQRWRVFIKAVFGLPMTDADRAVYTEHTGRSDLRIGPYSEAALIVGRRGGKSRTLALIAVYLACFRDYGPHLAPGEVATVAILAANRAQARSIFRYCIGLLKAVPLLAQMVAKETDETIELTNRVVIEISTASFRTTRGYSFAAILADEVAFWRSDETSANPDVEILRALRPGLASIPGSMLLLASSPYAKRGELYNSYRRYHSKEGARVLCWQADTASMNPSIPAEIINEAYEEDPEAAKAEYGAQFRDDLADFVTRETVEAVTCWGRKELPPLPGVEYAAFCDPSGGISDAMVLAIGHLQSDATCVLDAVLEIRPPFDPETAVRDCARLCRSYRISKVTGDRYAGQWPVARFREHGIAFEQSARPKSDLYHDLLPLLNAGRVELLDNQRLIMQLVGLERRVSRQGKDSIDHTPGGHDDVANAVAGLLVSLDLDRRPALLRANDLLIDEQPAPVPVVSSAVFAATAVDERGTVAVVYCALAHPGMTPPLTLLDFEVTGITAKLWIGIEEQLRALAKTCRTRTALLCVPEVLLPSSWAAGVHAMPIPGHFKDPGEVAIAVAGYVAAGQVKMCQQVAEKAATLPFRASLDFRSGDVGDDPLRHAAVLAIALGLEDQRAVRRPVRV
jgi:hypothetical protein